MNKIGSDQSIWPVRQETGQVQPSFIVWKCYLNQIKEVRARQFSMDDSVIKW